jgi:hypothetical protein
MKSAENPLHNAEGLDADIKAMALGHKDLAPELMTQNGVALSAIFTRGTMRQV